jgi:hypothetical protein
VEWWEKKRVKNAEKPTVFNKNRILKTQPDMVSVIFEENCSENHRISVFMAHKLKIAMPY